MASFLTRHPRNSNNNSPTTLWRTWDSFAQDFDSFFEDFDRALNGNTPSPRSSRDQFFSPAADVQESEKAYELSFDMPGFKPDEMNIDVNGRTLTVTGQRERSVSDSKLHRSERFYGEYRRSITLPENVKADQIQANYENGVLSIEIPKIQIADARKIQINVGSQSSLGKGSGGESITKDKDQVAAQQNRARDKDVEQHQNLSH